MLLLLLLQVTTVHDLDELGPSDSFLGRHSQTPPDDLSEFGMSLLIIENQGPILHDNSEETRNVISLEGESALNNLIEEDADAPDIAETVVAVTIEHLRGHVEGGADLTLGQGGGVELLAETEVSHLEHSRVEQDVLGFQVAVKDLVFRQDPEGVEQLAHDGVEELVAELEVLFLLEVFESAFVAELLDEVVVVAGAEDLDEADDVLAPDLGQDLDLERGKRRDVLRSWSARRVSGCLRIWTRPPV